MFHMSIIALIVLGDEKVEDDNLNFDMFPLYSSLLLMNYGE